MRPSLRTFLLPALLAALTAGCDLGTKAWAQHALSSESPSPRAPCERRGDDGPFAMTRIPNHGIALVASNVELVYAENCAAAFGLLQNVSRNARRIVLSLGAILALAALVSMDRRLPRSRRLARAGLAIVLGGAIGNLADRIVRGYVVDFVFVHAGRFQWPIFNVADIAISCGIGLVVLDSLLDSSPKSAA